MRRRAWVALAALACHTALAQVPPSPAHPPEEPPFQGDAYRLMQEIGSRSTAYRNLEELCDDVGSRPNGSEALRNAQTWIREKLTASGIRTVVEEPFTIPSTWTRGVESARLITANGAKLRIAQVAWTPATAGAIRGEVVPVGGATIEELRASLASARGKIALRGDLPKAPGDRDPVLFKREVRALFDEAGVAALLFPMSRAGNTLQTVGTPARNAGQWTPAVPTAYVGQEHANLLRRLLARGRPVELELELGGQVHPGETRLTNLVAEVAGTRRPDEVVILGAHLDSVDLATGASDNGAGVVVLLDVLTAVKALGLRPDRTLRVIFFSGEELEGIGSRAYVRAHAGDLAGVQAVLVLDKGGGRILGWPTMGQESWVPLLAEAIAPAYTVDALQIIPGQIRGSDHDAFFEAGVPAFFAYQEALDYWDVYHSDLDSLDHVKPATLVQAGQALAAAAWGFLQLDRRLPHLPPREAPAHP